MQLELQISNINFGILLTALHMNSSSIYKCNSLTTKTYIKEREKERGRGTEPNRKIRGNKNNEYYKSKKRSKMRHFVQY